MKAVCRNCHFLAKDYPEENTVRTSSLSLTQQERDKAEQKPEELVPAHYSLNCHMGVWDEGVGGKLERDVLINLTPRTSCFFFPYHPAMLYDAAKELQKRQSENEQLKKSNCYTRIALWVAAGALALDALIEFLKCVGKV